MATLSKFLPTSLDDKLYILTALAIVTALFLTIISMMGLCSVQCSEGHKYLLFGMPFEVFGLAFLTTVGVIHALQRKFKNLQTIESLMFASALGAELMFIIVQKYYIGTWCPVCLGIASCIAIGAGSFATSYALNTKKQINSGNKGEMMKSFWKGLTNTTAVFIGFFIAFMGISKYDAMEAAQTSIEEKLAFGNKNSDVEVYLFTDWACPACRKLEPNLEEISIAIEQEASLIFVDHVVHPETLNYIPFHLSFILKNKDQYFQLRDMLTKMSAKTGSPSEEQVAAEAAKIGVEYNELNYSDIALAIKYYKTLGEKFKIKGTPTMVIINRDAKKGKKLAGNGEITKEKALDAINSLKQL